MSKVRLEFHVDGFYDLRRDSGVVSMLDEKAQQVADSANEMGKGTYAVGSRQGEKRPQGRWRASVVTADATAIAHNAKHHILARAVGEL